MCSQLLKNCFSSSWVHPQAQETNSFLYVGTSDSLHVPPFKHTPSRRTSLRGTQAHFWPEFGGGRVRGRKYTSKLRQLSGALWFPSSLSFYALIVFSRQCCMCTFPHHPLPCATCPQWPLYQALPAPPSHLSIPFQVSPLSCSLSMIFVFLSVFCSFSPLLSRKVDEYTDSQGYTCIMRMGIGMLI